MAEEECDTFDPAHRHPYDDDEDQGETPHILRSECGTTQTVVTLNELRNAPATPLIVENLLARKR